MISDSLTWICVNHENSNVVLITMYNRKLPKLPKLYLSVIKKKEKISNYANFKFHRLSINIFDYHYQKIISLDMYYVYLLFYFLFFRHIKDNMCVLFALGTDRRSRKSGVCRYLLKGNHGNT
jgi:hypothetical protein